MAKIKRYTKEDGGYRGELGFMCLGCGNRHFINDNMTEESPKNIWEFNGEFEHPTIKPSILFRSYTKNPETEVYDIEKDRCHSFITNGTIQYLGDCQHKLAGQTIELPEIE